MKTDITDEKEIKECGELCDKCKCFYINRDSDIKITSEKYDMWLELCPKCIEIAKEILIKWIQK